MPGPIGLAVRGVAHGVQTAKKKWKERKDGPEEDDATDGSEIEETNAPETEPPGNDDPQNKSKRQSYYAVLLVGFVFALDFTAALMSIQPFWYYIGGGGHENLYGLTFGSYDLTQMVSAPILGYFVDRDVGRFKSAFVIAAVVNGCGNLLYAFTALIDHWWSMLVARLISGLGAGALSLGAAYLTMVTTMEQRTARLGSYRVSQSLARQLGPFIGFLFLGLPALNQEGGNSTALKVFNWYTIPGWFTFVVVVVVLGFFLYMFVNPSEENGHIVPKDESEEMSKEVYTFFLLYLPVHLGLGLAIWAFVSNLFGLAAGQFHIVADQVDNWRVFVGLGAGAIGGAYLYKNLTILKSIRHAERYFLALSPCFVLCAWLLTISYQGETDVPPAGLFYASTVAMGIGISTYYASSETFFSKKLTQYHCEGTIAKFIGLYAIVSAGSRFSGPLIAGAVTRVSDPAGNVNTLDCNFLNGDQYVTEGCVLYNNIPFFSAMAGFTFLLIVSMVLILMQFGSYGMRKGQKDAEHVETSMELT